MKARDVITVWSLVLILAAGPALSVSQHFVYSDSPFLSNSLQSQRAESLLAQYFPNFTSNASTIYVIFKDNGTHYQQLEEAASLLPHSHILTPNDLEHSINSTQSAVIKQVVLQSTSNLTKFYLLVHQLYLRLNQTREQFLQNLSQVVQDANLTFSVGERLAQLSSGSNYSAAYEELSPQLNGIQLKILEMIYGNLTIYGNPERAAAQVGASYFHQPLLGKLGFSNYTNQSLIASLLPNGGIYHLNTPDAFSTFIGRELGVKVNTQLMLDPSLIQYAALNATQGYFPPLQFRSDGFSLYEVQVPSNESLNSVEAFMQKLPDAYVTGHLPIYAESAFTTSSELEIIDLITVISVSILLIVLLRALVPILTLIVTAGAALDLAYGLTFISSLFGYRIYYISGFVIAPIVFGLTVDYSILFLYRYLEEIRSNRDPLTRARKSTTRTILMSGVSVALGFSSFVLTPSSLLKNIGLALLLAAISSLLTSLTFYPTLLSLIRPKYLSFPRKEIPSPQDVRQEYLVTVSKFAVKRKWLIVGVMVLITIGSLMVILSHPTNVSVGEIVPPGSEVIKGEDTLSQLYNYSQLYALTTSSTQARNITDLLLSNGAWVYGPYSLGRNATTLGKSIFYSHGYYLIEALVPGSVFSNGAVEITSKVIGLGLVGGANAQRIDIVNQTVFDYFHYTLPLTIALVVVYLLLVMRSAITPPRLAATILVSSVIGVAAMKLTFRSVYWLSPLIVFALMFSLGIDYDVFLVSRVMEEEGDEEERILKAVKVTGLVITAAGLILGAAFLSLMAADVRFLVEIGMGVGFSVLLDTFVVRTIFVPAVMSILKKYNWWPKRVRSS